MTFEHLTYNQRATLRIALIELMVRLDAEQQERGELTGRQITIMEHAQFLRDNLSNLGIITTGE